MGKSGSAENNPHWDSGSGRIFRFGTVWGWCPRHTCQFRSQNGETMKLSDFMLNLQFELSWAEEANLRDTINLVGILVLQKTLSDGPGINISATGSQFWCVQIRQVPEKHLFVCHSSCVNGTGYNTLAAILKRQNDFDFTCEKGLRDRIFQISLESFRKVAQKCGSEAVKGLSKFCSEDFYIWLILYNFPLWS